MSSVYIPSELRERIARQALYRCGYCLTQEAVVGTAMEVEHIFPFSLGGPTVEDNLWLACSFCNLHKGTRTFAEDPTSGQVSLLFNPRFQVWEDHFAWEDRGTRIAGRTPVGRASIRTLKLNRPLLVEARQLWVAAGWHPPVD